MMSIEGAGSSVTSHHSGARGQSASSSPWSLTYFQGSGDVFIWKRGQRLKASDGVSAGRVNSVSVLFR